MRLSSLPCAPQLLIFDALSDEQTTAVKAIAAGLQGSGCRIRGFITEEVRANGSRIGACIHPERSHAFGLAHNVPILVLK